MFWNLWKINFPIFAIFIFWRNCRFCTQITFIQKVKYFQRIYENKWPKMVNIFFCLNRCAIFWSIWKTILQFLFFEKWLILYSKFLDNWLQLIKMVNYLTTIDHFINNHNSTKNLVFPWFCSWLDQNAFQKILRIWKKNAYK